MTTFHIEQHLPRDASRWSCIEHQFREQGCLLAANSATAEFVVLNTCTVTSAADTGSRRHPQIHAANPLAKIIVTGCYAQRARKISWLPGVAFVVGNSHKPQILHSFFPCSETPRFLQPVIFFH